MIRALLLGLALALGAAPLRAEAPCRQALALGLDVSGSVDAREYRQQIGGLADALSDPRVAAALLALPGQPVDLLVYEWSGASDQAVILPWTAIASDATLDAVVAKLRGTTRRETSPGTALGTAMQFGAARLAERAHCGKHTLDISGDGISNYGPRPRDIRHRLEARRLTINALVIGADAPVPGDSREAEIGGLSSYFRAEVILGPDAFVQTALGFDDYARAMAEKLLRELDGLMVSQISPSRHPLRHLRADQ
ncbi:DUF1194 domain-containing protein [Sulfitobacter sp. PS-8MA]|uniref:DUF1194 domain-containing protein n=1 Tax=Sulfitobacter sp. PS-8MA TaxID=3237707 RepID=UPI0034C65BD4